MHQKPLKALSQAWPISWLKIFHFMIYHIFSSPTSLMHILV